MDKSSASPASGLRKLASGVYVHIVLIVLLGLLAYSNTFDVPFHFDDKGIIENPRIRSLENIPSFFTEITGPLGQRPLVLTTFAVNYAIEGLDATTGYHAVNLALHLLNGVLLYMLVLMTGRLTGRQRTQTGYSALFLTLLFVVHPVQTESVTYIVTRSMPMVTTFYLAGIMLFVSAVNARGVRKGLCITGLFVVSLFGMASREDFVTFPLMLVLYDLFFVSGFRLRGVLGNWREYVPVLLALPYMAYLVLSYDFYQADAGFGVKALSPVEYLMTQFNVQWTYLRLLVLPISQNLDYDYPVARTLFELPTIVSFLGYAGLWAAALAFVRKRPMVSFSMLWFLITITPASSFVPLIDLIFEHRLYLPSIGAFGVLTAGAFAALGRLRGNKVRAGIVVLLVLVPVVFSIASYARNELWRSGITLWEDVVRKSPLKARGHSNLGGAYYQEGLFEKAEEHLRTAVTLAPYHAEARSNLGFICRKKGQIAEAKEHFEVAVKAKPFFPEAHHGLALVFRSEGERSMAERHFKIAASLRPYPEAHYNLGIIYMEKGDLKAARMEFQKALAIRPGYIKARRFLDYTSRQGEVPPH